MKNLLITLLATTFLVSSCCLSCRDNAAPTYLMDQDFKEYIFFPTGSYWVYFTDLGQKDSVHLSQQEVGIDESQRVYPFNFEGFSQSLSSSFFEDDLFGGGGPIEHYDTILFTYAEKYKSQFLVTG